VTRNEKPYAYFELKVEVPEVLTVREDGLRERITVRPINDAALASVGTSITWNTERQGRLGTYTDATSRMLRPGSKYWQPLHGSRFTASYREY